MVEDQAAVVEHAKVLPIEAPLPPSPICNVPLSMVVPPAYVLLPLRVSTPPPVIARLPRPLGRRRT